MIHPPLNVNVLTALLDGGAANAAMQLHEGLREQGVHSRLYYSAALKHQTPAPPDAFPARWNAGPPMRWPARWGQYLSFRVHRTGFKRTVRNRPRGNEIFTSPRGGPHTAWPPAGHPVTAAEIIHLHWVAKLIDQGSFFASLPPHQPVVWTLHDMNPFTGGCHFTVDCERFASGCGDCPQLPSRGPRDISRTFFRIKRDALRGINLHVVAASRWLLEQARRSPIFADARSFRRIPYGLPLRYYRPVDRDEARRRLGLDPDDFLFAFGAVDVENRRKGAGLLLRALAHVADRERVKGLVLGSGELPPAANPLPPITSMGFVSDVERRVLIYSASDVFVLPSTGDNMPLTGLEAMASGTPILGFDAGGIPDFTRPGQTGMLAPSADADALGQQLRHLCEHRDQAAAMGRRARQVIEAEYSSEREAADYIRLYAAILSGEASPAPADDPAAGLTDSM